MTLPASDSAPARSRHVPQRTCVACRRTRPQAELLRLTRREGEASWQVTAPGERRAEGRGRYLCADTPACWSEKRLRRSFGAAAPALAEQLTAYAVMLSTDPV